MNDIVEDRGPRSGAERVPRNTARERGKTVVVRDAHDDPLDDIGVSQDADIHERSAPRVDALEREPGVTATPADNREQRDVVATDPDNDRVVDGRGNPVPDVKAQETPHGVDAFRCATECLERLDCFEGLPDADGSA